MTEHLYPKESKPTLLERYLANQDQTQLPGDVQREVDNGTIDDPMWYWGRTGLGLEDVLDAPQEEIDELKAYFGE